MQRLEREQQRAQRDTLRTQARIIQEEFDIVGQIHYGFIAAGNQEVEPDPPIAVGQGQNDRPALAHGADPAFS